MGASHESDPWPRERDLRALVDRVPGTIYRAEVSPPWRVHEISEGVTVLTGRPPEAFRSGGVTWADVILPDDLRALLAADEELTRPGQEYSLEYRVVHVDGSHRWVRDAGRVVQHPENLPFLAGVIIDVTEDVIERKRAEAALRESEERYRTAFVTSPDAVNVNRLADGLFVDVNEGFVRVTGWERREVIGRTSAEIGIWTDLKDRERLVDTLARDGVCHNLEATFQMKGGRTVRGLMSARLIVYQGVPCILSVTRDISDLRRAEHERHRLEMQLQQAQKLESLGVLAGGIAHDFNNILMAVLGHAELALEELSPVSPARNSIGEIVTAARRAGELCRQMLAYSGRASFALERVHLPQLVEEMLHLLRATISKKAVLNVDMPTDLPPIKADPSQIRQVVLNLVLNASEAIGDRSGAIGVSAGVTVAGEGGLAGFETGPVATGRYVQLDVADSGCGMTPEVRSRIFEPFFTTKFSGRGLGLAALLGIVRGHKGAIRVQSEPGKGSRFTLLFPAPEGPDGPGDAVPHSVQPPWRGSGTVLFADDEDSLRALGTRMLERLGYTVITAADGREAVEIYRRRQSEIDLVILDLMMPHLDGSQAFGLLRGIDPGVHVVLVSGYTPEDVVARTGGQPPTGVLQKPYTLARIRDLLSTLPPRRP